MNEQVCAVVVTYNRKELLRECVQALLAQEMPLSSIVVVDNCSTDGTRDLVATDFSATRYPQIELVSLPRNIGGAGGFHEGIRLGAEKAEWLWIMDDDTIPQPGALIELFAARERFPEEKRPDLVASKVVWTDGSMHPMNVPRLKRADLLETATFAAEHGCLSLRATSFVSLLMHRRFVAEFGLPITDYFIWNDDVEYTARVLMSNLGVLAPKSLVVHKTKEKKAPAGPRFYYAIRNQLWMILRSSAWTREERLMLFLSMCALAATYLRRSPDRWSALAAIGRGVVDGLARTPGPR